jgi:excisionase family DNA binding protein
MKELLLTQITLEEFKSIIKSELTTSAPEPKREKAETYLTENEAREFLKVSKVTLKKWRDTGKLSFYRAGSRIRYNEADINEFLKEKKYRRANTTI